MATYADLRNEIVAALEALSTRTRMASDWRTDLERLADGETRYQLRIVPAQKAQPGSNVTRDVALVGITTGHMLADRFAERLYTEGQMWTDLDLLAQQSWWRGLASVYDIESDIEVEIDRVVNVVSYTLAVSVSLIP